MVLTRRRFLAGSLALAGLPNAGGAAVHEARRLVVRPGEAQLLPAGPASPIWGYDGQVPGPLLRVRQGETLTIEAENELPTPTTVHWHGIRLPNAMDGVPGLTQPPIGPGGRFRYSFATPDAGTFWYHPHLATSEQVARGLAGALVVDEPEPPPVDRDLVWMVSDWGLYADGTHREDFDDPILRTHDGRLGELITINGEAAPVLTVARGERLRLRLVNACAARIVALAFPGLEPSVVARDGQPCRPHAAEEGLVRLGPGMRADLLLDVALEPGGRSLVEERQNPRVPLVVATLACAGVLREQPLAGASSLPPNPLPRPDLAAAEPLEFLLAGGMGGHSMAGADHSMGAPWTINGASMPTEGGHGGHHPAALLTLGRSYRLAFVNESEWWHPMHLHGMHMALLGPDGGLDPRGLWLDTLLLAPRQRLEAVLVADNPGLWMLHCHVLQHQDGGMAAVLQVA